ncbi:hypothetical protein ABE142_26490 [Paenibacillus alvei]|uniref:hypothetical protein n=1 Tax=Paenibacillus alvei TaxID=44250 RepID=UPI003D28D776
MKNIKGFFTKGVSKIKKTVMALSVGAFATLAGAKTMFAANADLDKVTTELTTGAEDMKVNAITIIGVCIAIFVVVFGIGWLIKIFKKKMSAAA